MRGGQYRGKSRSRMRMESSNRQLEILRLVAAGLEHHEIANRTGVVTRYVGQVIKKHAKAKA